jgi:aromatic-L-amino-acid/L-tryptophan decarboxylase
MSPDEFRRHGHTLVEWIARYFETLEQHPVLPKTTPGALANALPGRAPELPERFDDIIADLDRLIVPHATHWNHPGFFAYFAISGSAPGVLMEFVSAALNQQAMLWRTSPAATELEQVTLRWLAQLMHLPPDSAGVIYDTASISTMHALAAARELSIEGVRFSGLSGRTDVPGVRVYCSEQAHSSIDKSAIVLGLGRDAVVRIRTDAEFRMDPKALGAAIRADRASGLVPIAVIATCGTTSTTSVDPVAAVADVCAEHRLWLHVDAAYAGVMAMVPGFEWMCEGFDKADSIVVNPHKWLFTPFDLSVLFTRRMDVLRQAFALSPDYLQTTATESALNLMDTGIQLGRRFRALKLWAILRYFGAEGIRSRLREHVRIAQLFGQLVDADSDFERVAPTPFSVVCFRARGSDELNERLLARVNQSGHVFLSHTRLNGRFVLRLAVGNLRTEERHVRMAWDIVTTELRAANIEVRA